MGESASLLVVDEAWYATLSSWGSLVPILAQRPNPQAWSMTASNEHMKDLVPAQMSDPDVLNMVWGAHPDENPLHPDTWQAASPFWGTVDAGMSRHRLMSSQQRNPAFVYEYLSRLPAENTGRRVWLPNWPGHAEVLEAPGDVVAALDKGTAPEQQFSAVVAWRTAADRVALIAKTGLRDADEAVAWARAHGAATLIVGATYLPTITPTPGVKMVKGVTQLTNERSRLFSALVHDGRIVTDGSLDVQDARADDHGILSAKHSVGEITSVKCAVWAAGEALRRDKPEQPRAQVW